jgi:hypothetical protein
MCLNSFCEHSPQSSVNAVGCVEVGACYWTDATPGIVNPEGKQQGSGSA